VWQDTFEYAKSWVNALREEDSTMVIVLAANKSDLQDPRAFMKEANKYAQDENLPIFETSAKTGAGVQELFAEVASQVAKRHNRSLREDESQGGSSNTTGGNRDSIFGRDLTHSPAPAAQPHSKSGGGGCNC